MENKNKKAKELEIEQLEKVNGGDRGFTRTYTCKKCGAYFDDFRSLADHQEEHVDALATQDATK